MDEEATDAAERLHKRRTRLIRTTVIFTGFAIASYVFQGSIESIGDAMFMNRQAMALGVVILNLMFILSLMGAGFYGIRAFLEFGGKLDQIKVARSRFEFDGPTSESSPDLSTNYRLPNAEAIPSPPDLHANPLIVVERMRLRLMEEIESQGARANLNLSAGVLTALAAIMFLIWLAYETRYANTAQITGSKSHFPPILYWGSFLAKVALSVTANVFSFFFLSTYRRNLGEIKYFQNELTNIESKIFAVLFSSEKSLNSVLTKSLTNLANSERNFILRKGQTTVDLQLKEMDRGEIRSLLTILSDNLRAISVRSRGKQSSENETA